MKGKAISAWHRLSSKGTTSYEIILWENGELSCNCPGWIYPRDPNRRDCKHTKELKIQAFEIFKGKSPKVFEEDRSASVSRSEILGTREGKGRMLRFE